MKSKRRPGEPTDEQFRARAKADYEDEGTLEIDDDAKVSCADPMLGAYVQAWVWVENDWTCPTCAQHAAECGCSDSGRLGKAGVDGTASMDSEGLPPRAG